MDDQSQRVFSIEDPQQRLAALLTFLIDLESTRSKALSARDDTIRELYRSGTRIVDIVSITGLTRARINQILSGTR